MPASSGAKIKAASVGESNGLGLQGDLPLIIAFVVLAAYTYFSGLRAPALIAVVKDLLIYVMIIVAAVIIPIKLGGYGTILAAVPETKLMLAPQQFLAYATLALGSALALFMYPHSITGVLSSKSGNVVRRNMALLPIYGLMLGFIALQGYMALAAGIQPQPPYGAQWVVPALFLQMFPSWFVGAHLQPWPSELWYLPRSCRSQRPICYAQRLPRVLPL
jgi:SSS family solute:Na+ symporter